MHLRDPNSTLYVTRTLTIMATSQLLPVDDLLAQIRALISGTTPPAVLRLSICVEGTDEQTTIRVSLQDDGSLLSLPTPERPTSSCPHSSIASSTAGAAASIPLPSSADSASSVTSSQPLEELSDATALHASAAFPPATAPAEESNDQVNHVECARPLLNLSNNSDGNVDADRLQRLILHDDAAQTISASPSAQVEPSAVETSPPSTSSPSNLSSSDSPTTRHSSRRRTAVQRLDCLVAASTLSSPSRRKRPAAIASTEEDSPQEEEAEETTRPQRAVRSSPSVLSSASSSSSSTPRKRKRRSTNTCINRLPSATTADAEVALLAAKLRAAAVGQPSTRAVSEAAVLQLAKEVLECGRRKGEASSDGNALAAYEQQSGKIAILISTSASLRMVGYYLRAVLAARLKEREHCSKATQHTTFAEAARLLLGIKSPSDVAAYPAFYSFVQQHCPSVAASDIDMESWLKEPVLIADISWTAWRRYLGQPNRWILDKAMEMFKWTASAGPSPPSSPSSSSSTVLSLDSSPSSGTDASSSLPQPLSSSEVDDMDEEASLSDIDWEMQLDEADVQTSRRGTRKRPKPIWTAAMTVSGHVLDAATAKSLQQLVREHHRLTKDTWNSHTFHLAEHDEAVAVGLTNGEMRQAPFCELLQTLMTHPSIPTYARLQAEQTGAEHFWLDVGSGYGLAVLRARIVTEVKVCAGIEIVEDRVSISHRLAEKVGMQKQVHFVSSDVCSPQALPILLAATHLFAFSAVFSAATQDYLASVLSRPDSSWLVYTTCDTSDVFTRAGIEVHTEPHGAECKLGGVHLLGHTKPLSMAVSSQAFTAFTYLRCVPPNTVVRARAWATGMATLRERSEAAALQASEAMDRTLKSVRRELRSAIPSSSSLRATDGKRGRASG